MPGPLFTFAAYLGAAAASHPGGAAGAALALIAIFLRQDSWSCSAPCRSGMRFASGPAPAPRWPASTPRSSASSPPPSTIQSGLARCKIRPCRFRHRRRRICRARRLARPAARSRPAHRGGGRRTRRFGELGRTIEPSRRGSFSLLPSSGFRKRLPICANFGTLAADDLMIDRTKKLPARFYVNPSGRKPVREWIFELSEADRHTVGKDIQKVEFGWPLGRPHCAPLGGGLWEVRSALGGNRIGRVISALRRLHDLAAWLHQEDQTTRGGYRPRVEMHEGGNLMARKRKGSVSEETFDEFLAEAGDPRRGRRSCRKRAHRRAARGGDGAARIDQGRNGGAHENQPPPARSPV